MAIRSFTEFVREQDETNGGEDGTAHTGGMTKWISNQVQNTERPHDEIKSDFIKKFGAGAVKYFDDTVSQLVN